MEEFDTNEFQKWWESLPDTIPNRSDELAQSAFRAGWEARGVAEGYHQYQPPINRAKDYCITCNNSFENGKHTGKQYKLVSIVHDGDCTDCSQVTLEVPSHLDMMQAQDDYHTWYREEYTTGRAKRQQYMSFDEWLINKRNARLPEMEEYNRHV